MINRFLASDPDARVLQQAGFLRFALIFVQGIILVRAGVPLGVIGQIELVFFLANFMMFYLQNGGRNSLLSWVPKAEGPEEKTKRLAAVFLTMHLLGILAAIVLFIVIGLDVLPSYEFIAGSDSLYYLIGYVLFTVPVTPLIFNYLLTGRRNRILAFITISYIVQVAVVLTPFLMGMDVHTMIMALAIFAVCRWLFCLVDGKWFTNGLPKRRLVAAFAVFSIPLIVHAFNSGLMDYVDGWIVSWFFGDETFAVYRYGAKEFPVNMLLIGGLVTGLIPGFRSAGAVDPRSMRAEILRLIKTLFPINCLLILISPLLYEWVYSADFVLSARIFNIYALTLVSRVIINQVYLYVFHHNWVLAISTFAEILVNVGLSILLLEHMGILGIPLATVLAFAAHRIFIMVYLKVQMRADVTQYLPVKAYAIASLAMLLCFFIAEMSYF